ncbi:glycosyltransferase family 4 protein [Flavobacterium beibuense]|uniref:glycosyltransferase family 4 protein n=1 Tax=Flavobacterium beibuense TaxID=657326 RepID=UPI003A91DB4B
MKKVLIITYYWPPAGGPGVQRWLKFVKYLPEYGIEPIVYIPKNPTYPLIDEELQKDVSYNTTILKNNIIEPYGWASVFSKKNTKKISSGIIPDKKKQSVLQKLMLWVRGNMFIPDARVLWVRPSVSYLSNYLQGSGIDTIITTGPPHSLHLIGMELQKRFGVKWIADFRDPWTTIGYHKELRLSESSQQRHKKMEHDVLNTVDSIIVTSPTTKTEFEQLTDKPVTVITNGYDVELVAKEPLDEKFTLAHIGSFLSERNPKILWESLSELVNEDTEFKDKFELKLIGAVSQEVLTSIEQHGLTDYINNMGYVSHSEAVKQQRKSQVLLLVEIDSLDTRCIIPGKLFEYMASERPVIGIGPQEADFADIIKTTNTGVFVEYTEKEKLKDALKSYFVQYMAEGVKVHAIGLQQYSRRNLTNQLANLLKQS